MGDELKAIMWELIREYVVRMRDCAVNFECLDCHARGVTKGNGIEHTDRCIVSRAQAALAAHEAEWETLAHERDVYKKTLLTEFGEDPADLTDYLRQWAARMRKVVKKSDEGDERDALLHSADAYDAVADLLEAEGER